MIGWVGLLDKNALDIQRTHVAIFTDFQGYRCFFVPKWLGFLRYLVALDRMAFRAWHDWIQSLYERNLILPVPEWEGRMITPSMLVQALDNAKQARVWLAANEAGHCCVCGENLPDRAVPIWLLPHLQRFPSSCYGGKRVVRAYESRVLQYRVCEGTDCDERFHRSK